MAAELSQLCVSKLAKYTANAGEVEGDGGETEMHEEAQQLREVLAQQEKTVARLRAQIRETRVTRDEDVRRFAEKLRNLRASIDNLSHALGNEKRKFSKI
jgi:septal ring factor EnvC (AmiA/AmiB activator)